MNGTKVAKRGARLSLLFVVWLVSGTASMGQEATKTKSKGPVTAKKDEPKKDDAAAPTAAAAATPGVSVGICRNADTSVS